MGLDLIEVLFVQPNDLIYPACDEWMEIVPIESETLSHTGVVGWQFCPVPIECDLVVVVEILQHPYDLPNRRDVYIFLI